MATDATETKHEMLLEVTESKGPERRRQGKFQPFKRLFGRKKKREAKGGFDGAELKASFSTGEVRNGVVSDDEESSQNLRDLNPIGSRALSHDSIFIPEEPATEAGLDHSMSQENVSDKVRNLQKQIAQGIKFGQRPPSLRKSEGDEGSSDEEEVPRSPLKVLAQVEAEPAITEPKVQGAHQAGPHSTPVKSPRSKRVIPPTGTIESINLDSVPQSVPRLDNTAARHKLSVKPKNQRISRKHRRFTQDLQEVDIPGVLQEDFEAAVSSGEKQILFQKVNLTPVTPASSYQSAAAAERRESTSSSEGPESPNLPTSPFVPHTAILVTGAQLCGTAVNMDQIKDSACKSLLGLGEDRKAQGTPPTKSKTSPDRKSGKTKSLNESSLSTDQSVLAEWASIRSKIFKGVEEGKYDEQQEQSKNQPQPGSEDTPAFSHTNLRKTMSASAKFSITPAKKKFGDSNRNSEVFGAEEKEAGEEGSSPESPIAASPAPSSKPQNRTSKTVRIVERGSEECMFAKDLPSFLVPSPGAKPEAAELKSRGRSETGASESGEEGGQEGDDNPSPFGIKLRRTNFSLRFHSEQSTEKRKKRYSAGDSFDGVPSPLTPMETDSDTSSVFSDKSISPSSPQKEGAAGKYLHASASPAAPRAKPGKSSSSSTHSEGEKVLSKPPIYRRPTTSPKPSGAVPTPPPSPLPKEVHVVDAVIQRTGAAESSSQEKTLRSEEHSAVAQLHRSSQSQVREEEEPKEKRSFFPSINIPWREKTDRKSELIKKEKPSLQSRHSLDSSKVTLVSPTESRGSGSTSPSSKPQTPEEPKRPDSLLGRFERREHLKKANTYPALSRVRPALEIADSTPSPPAVKEVSKRFPSSDSPQVSTEPAWLALAKRKAKAWSDCPQIIK
ncbi:Cancer-related regulator of actin dynamics like [Dissostichus eleginoides]|uniref:Cancer-related regulator of actin dynamics like n=1 Tax=Dissostichus eleginoides TaxID=100907 RepID=A0AAD9CB33_DISEL|nr:Cancer-related regulator of actin dynamics like [Dissostichus eleginoides]